MPNERINVLNWDSGGSNTWASSSLKAYLNDTYYNGITANKSAIISHDWYAGVLSSASINMSAEKSTIVTDYVGIPSVSDYLKAGGKSSWMNKAGLYYWLINPYYNTYSHNIFFVDASRSGELGIYGNPSELSSVFPAIFLKADTRISGDGQEDHPYIIENYKL